MHLYEIWIIINFISLIIDFLIINKIFTYFSKKRTSKNFVFISFLVVIVILFFLNSNSNNAPMIYIFFSIILYYINYETSLFKLLIIPSLYWLIYLFLIKYISSILVININYTEQQVLKGDIFALEMMLLAYIFLIFLVFIIKFVVTKNNFIKNIHLIFFMFINIVSFLLIFRGAAKDINVNFVDNILIMIIGFTIVIFNLYLLSIMDKLLESRRIEIENKFMKDKIEIEYKYIKKLQYSNENIRILKHDIKNHLTCIRNIHNNKEALDKYLDSIDIEVNKIDNIYDTGSIIVDAILDEKKIICDNYNIKLYVKANFTGCDFISAFDLCTIMSNLLDNAIESNLKVKNLDCRNITIKANCENYMLIIIVENNKSNKIIKSKHSIITDKKNKTIHGLGLKSVKKSIGKYNGDLFVEYNDENFKVKIIIPTNI